MPSSPLKTQGTDDLISFRHVDVFGNLFNPHHTAAGFCTRELVWLESLKFD
jgi:hypothetical protein